MTKIDYPRSEHARVIDHEATTCVYGNNSICFGSNICIPNSDLERIILFISLLVFTNFFNTVHAQIKFMPTRLKLSNEHVARQSWVIMAQLLYMYILHIQFKVNCAQQFSVKYTLSN